IATRLGPVGLPSAIVHADGRMRPGRRQRSGQRIGVGVLHDPQRRGPPAAGVAGTAVARGSQWVAEGVVPGGIVSLGIVSRGIVSLGIVSLGIVSRRLGEVIWRSGW